MDRTIQGYNQLIQYFESNYMNLGAAILFLVVGFLVANFIQKRISRRLAKKSPNHITANFTAQIGGFVLKAFVIFTALYMLGLNAFTNKLLASAGILTFVIGFALKDIGENFLAGMILAFKSPFRLNDLIEVGAIVGQVKDISIRETMVKTLDGKDVFVPNAMILKNPLINYTLDGFLRYEFVVGIAYESDTAKALKLILDTVSGVEGVLTDGKKPGITISELGTNTIQIMVQFWVDTFRTTRRSVHDSIRSQVMHDVLDALVAHGFSLPANVVELKNYEASGDVHLKMNE
jgi:small-conductance mechanosensitive channel